MSLSSELGNIDLDKAQSVVDAMLGTVEEPKSPDATGAFLGDPNIYRDKYPGLTSLVVDLSKRFEATRSREDAARINWGVLVLATAIMITAENEGLEVPTE
jgi:hypothetical protein